MLLRKLIFLLLLLPIALFPQGTVRIERGTLAARPDDLPDSAYLSGTWRLPYIATDQNPCANFRLQRKRDGFLFGDSRNNPVKARMRFNMLLQLVKIQTFRAFLGHSPNLMFYSAICNLPGGNCSTQTAGSGTVYVISGTSAAPRSTLWHLVDGTGRSKLFQATGLLAENKRLYRS